MPFPKMLLKLRHTTGWAGIMAWLIAKTEVHRNLTADCANSICVLQQMNRDLSVEVGLRTAQDPIMIYNVK